VNKLNDRLGRCYKTTIEIKVYLNSSIDFESNIDDKQDVISLRADCLVWGDSDIKSRVSGITSASGNSTHFSPCRSTNNLLSSLFLSIS
jgi:hypothetical protein